MAGQVKRLSIGWAIFGAAAVVSAAVILVSARDTVFSGDELGILFRLAYEPLGTALFEPPPEKYLIAVPTLLYGGLAETVGTGSYLAYRLLGIALVVLAAGLFFALARRRAPLALALGCAIVLLFFGAAFEVLSIPARVPGQVAVCAGLGALLALDRGDRKGDVIACALGVVGVLSHPIAFAFIAAAAVVLVLRRPRGWRELWVVAIPVAIYALWWLTLRQPAESDVPITLGDIWAFARDAFVAVCAALTGIFRSPWVDDGEFITAASRLIALLALLGAVVAIVRARRVSAGLLAALVALALNLVGPVLAPVGIAFGFRDPAAERYLYPGAVIVLLVLVELAGLRRGGQAGEDGEAKARAGSRFGGLAGPLLAALGAAVLVISLVSNVPHLVEAGGDYRRASALAAGQFGAFDLTREGRTPEQRAAELGESVEGSHGWLALMLIFSNPDGVDKVVRAAPAYYTIRDRFGLPADDPATVRESLAEQVDRVVVASYPLRLVPGERASDVCRGRPPTDEGAAPLAIANGGLLIDAAEAEPPTVSVGRFSGMAVQPVAWPANARSALLELPTAVPASKPWLVSVQGADRVRTCDPPAA